MSIKDVYELSSYLQGDDKEREELERRKVLLVTSIKQQEARFLHELDQRQYIEQGYKDAQELATAIERDLGFIELHVSDRTGESSVEHVRKLVHEAQTLKQDISAISNQLAEMMRGVEDLEELKEANGAYDYDNSWKCAEVLTNNILFEKEQLSHNRSGNFVEQLEDIRQEIISMEKCRGESVTGQSALCQIYSNVKEMQQEIDLKKQLLRSSEIELNENMKQSKQQVSRLDCRYDEIVSMMEESNVQLSEQYCSANQFKVDYQHYVNLLQSYQQTLASKLESMDLNGKRLENKKESAAYYATQLKEQQQCSYLLDMQLQNPMHRNFIQKAENISFETEMLRSQLVSLSERNFMLRSQIECPPKSDFFSGQYKMMHEADVYITDLSDNLIPELTSMLNIVSQDIGTVSCRVNELQDEMRWHENRNSQDVIQIENLTKMLQQLFQSSKTWQQRLLLDKQLVAEKTDTAHHQLEGVRLHSNNRQSCILLVQSYLQEKREALEKKEKDQSHHEQVKVTRLKKEKEVFVADHINEASELRKILLAKDKIFQQSMKQQEFELTEKRDASKMQLKYLSLEEEEPEEQLNSIPEPEEDHVLHREPDYCSLAQLFEVTHSLPPIRRQPSKEKDSEPQILTGPQLCSFLPPESLISVEKKKPPRAARMRANI